MTVVGEDSGGRGLGGQVLERIDAFNRQRMNIFCAAIQVYRENELAKKRKRLSGGQENGNTPGLREVIS